MGGVGDWMMNTKSKQPKSFSLRLFYLALVKINGMKRFYLPLLVALLSSFYSSAQTHFITAWQTQGMIYTDYLPDYSFHPYSTGWPSHVNRDSLYIDINRDGVYDYRIFISASGSPGGGAVGYTLLSLHQNMIMTTLDSFHIYNPGHFYPLDTFLHIVAKRYFKNDSLGNSNDSMWRNGEITISKYIINGGTGTLVDWVISPDDPLTTPYYYFVKTVVNSDTLLGYIQLSSNNLLFDYASEGGDTAYIINSINDLPNNSSISTFPNPFTHQININYTKPFEYELMDYVGRVVMKGRAERSINTAQLAAGNYLLVMKNEEMYCVKKVVKE